MAVSQRARELALLRLAGATRRQVLGMPRTETVSVLLICDSPRQCRRPGRPHRLKHRHDGRGRRSPR
ncbi:hypothetical protein ACFWM5_37770 [Streptomyces bobili]|uniref:hypothetical protein n=1 Tax=Streptomyces bobili TaxID=67280 RepID=UPI00365FFD76